MSQVLISEAPKGASQITVGLEWNTVSAKDFKAQKRELRLSGQSVMVIPPSAGSKDAINFGTIGKSNLPREGRSLSLAAWLALTFRSGTVVAVEKVRPSGEAESPDDLFWYCIVNGGQVVSGTDNVDIWENAEYAVSELLDLLGQEEIGYIGTDSARLVTNLTGETPPSLSEALTKGAMKKAFLDPVSESKLVPIAAAAVVVCAAAGGGAWWWIASSAAEEEAIRAAQIARANQAAQAKQAYEDLVREVRERPSASKTISALWDNELKAMPTQVAGWELQEIECAAGECSAEWRNRDLTQPAVLTSNLASHCEGIDVDRSGTEAICTFDYEQPELAPLPEGENPLQSDRFWEMEDDQVGAMQSQLIELGSLGRGISYAMNNPITPSFRGSRNLKDVELFQEGGWAMTLPLELLEPSANTLAQYSGVTLSKLTLNWSSKTVELNGQYFQREDTQP